MAGHGTCKCTMALISDEVTLFVFIRILAVFDCGSLLLYSRDENHEPDFAFYSTHMKAIRHPYHPMS